MNIKERTGSIEWLGSFHGSVAHTKPRGEHRVVLDFGALEIETPSPLYKDIPYSQGLMHRALTPLRSYVFAKLNFEGHYNKVKWTKGMTRILGVRNKRAEVSPEVGHVLDEHVTQQGRVKVTGDLWEGDWIQVL